MSLKTILILLALMSDVLSQDTSSQGFVDLANSSSPSSSLILDLDNTTKSLGPPASFSTSTTSTKPMSNSGNGVPDLDAAVRASTAPEFGRRMSAGTNSMDVDRVSTPNDQRLIVGGFRRGSPVGVSMPTGFSPMNGNFMGIGSGSARMMGGDMGRGFMRRQNGVGVETVSGVGSAINNGINRNFMVLGDMGRGVALGVGSNSDMAREMGTVENDFSGSGRIGNRGFSGSDVLGRGVKTSDSRNNGATDSAITTSVSNSSDNAGTRTDRLELGSTSGMSGSRELMGGMTLGSLEGMMPRTMSGIMPGAMSGIVPGSMNEIVSGSMSGMSGSIGRMTLGSLMDTSFGGMGIDPRISGRIDSSALTGDATGFMGSDVSMSGNVFNSSRSFDSGFNDRVANGEMEGSISGIGGITGMNTWMTDPRFMSLMRSGMMTPDLMGSSGEIDSRLTEVAPFGLVTGMPGDFGSIGATASGAFGPRMSRFAGIGGMPGRMSGFMYPFPMTSFPVAGTSLPFPGTSIIDSSRGTVSGIISGRPF